MKKLHTTIVVIALAGALGGIQINPNDYYNAMLNSDYSYFENLVRSYNPGAAAWLMDAVIQLMLVILGVGFNVYTLNVVRHFASGLGNLLDGFGMFLRALWLAILTSIFIFLWSLLLIVPGIIAAYRYRMAFYLLIDNPSMTPYQCIRESKKMMAGHKGELFVLDLSFIGWYMLELIPLVSIWVVPYTQLTYTVYYDRLCGIMGYGRPAGEPAPGTDGGSSN